MLIPARPQRSKLGQAAVDRSLPLPGDAPSISSRRRAPFGGGAPQASDHRGAVDRPDHARRPRRPARGCRSAPAEANQPPVRCPWTGDRRPPSTCRCSGKTSGQPSP